MSRHIPILTRVCLTVFVSASVASLSAQDLSQLMGTIDVDGSSTVAPITVEAADSFLKKCPKVKIPVGVSGTGGGFKRFTKGSTDISDASRPIKPSEFQQCREYGVQFLELPIAYDGLTIVVNKENDWVEQLTVEQLQRIFRDDMKVSKWNELNPAWPDEEIIIFAPGTDSGTFDYFKEVVVGKEDASIRGDMSVSEDDNNLVMGVAHSRYAIGFFGAAYYFENTDKLRAVPIVNPDGEAVLPSVETVESGAYAPFSRPLFIYVNAKSARRPEVRVFVDFYLDNAADFAEEVGYVGLPDEIYEHARENFRRRRVGTHFVDEQGNKRSGSLVELFQEKNRIK